MSASSGAAFLRYRLTKPQAPESPVLASGAQGLLPSKGRGSCRLASPGDMQALEQITVSHAWDLYNSEKKWVEQDQAAARRNDHHL